MIKKLCLFLLLAFLSGSMLADQNQHVAVLLIPYNPTMHLSDSDPALSDGSGMTVGEMRRLLREELVKALNRTFADVHDVKMPARSFVTESNSDIDQIYHSLYYDQQKTFPEIYPSRFKHFDTTLYVSKTAKKFEEDRLYIHSGLRDHQLLKDLSEKYNTNYFIFLNEVDIKSDYNDCINTALKVYRRDIKVHFSIYDVSGKPVYGDVAVVHISTGTNNVREISAQAFPGIARSILNAFNAVVSSRTETGK